MTFKAAVIDKTESGQNLAIRQLSMNDLMEGDVVVDVSHSTLNYKDGLALTGRAPVVRRFPMIPGIDLAGVVSASSHPQFTAGDSVVLNGWGLGETHMGAFAEVARVKGDWLVPLPAELTAAQAMAVGTAGYTAMLCVLALETHGLTPGHGPVLVTGAAGGVGSVAVSLLSSLGWEVIVSTGRVEQAEYLKGLGASSIVDRAELAKPGKPLGKERWAAAVDSVGSTTLANVLASTRYGGAVAACGLAGGMDLPATVAPFILRGVTLLGIDSVMAPKLKRLQAWQRIARDLDREKLQSITQTVSLGQAVKMGQDILDGKVRGRVVVEVRA